MCVYVYYLFILINHGCPLQLRRAPRAARPPRPVRQFIITCIYSMCVYGVYSCIYMCMYMFVNVYYFLSIHVYICVCICL